MTANNWAIRLIPSRWNSVRWNSFRWNFWRLGAHRVRFGENRDVRRRIALLAGLIRPGLTNSVNRKVVPSAAF